MKTGRIYSGQEIWLKMLSGINFVGLEVLTTKAIRSYVFWDIMSCNPVKDN
jgi:hypothetical protein